MSDNRMPSIGKTYQPPSMPCRLARINSRMGLSIADRIRRFDIELPDMSRDEALADVMAPSRIQMAHSLTKGTSK